MFGTPIQIRIEEESIIISNRCILPEGWTTETLMQPHDSMPYNPGIANVFYRAGYIETWGHGIQKIKQLRYHRNITDKRKIHNVLIY